MSELTAEQMKNVLANRKTFAKMSLKDRLALRKTFQESIDLDVPLLRMSDSEKLELAENIRLIDRINLALVDAKRKPSGENQR